LDHRFHYQESTSRIRQNPALDLYTFLAGLIFYVQRTSPKQEVSQNTDFSPIYKEEKLMPFRCILAAEFFTKDWVSYRPVLYSLTTAHI
ncbi:MAG: hypothetical protein AAFO06_18500, partial [Cyanobacteria bacterium J06597_16]